MPQVAVPELVGIDARNQFTDLAPDVKKVLVAIGPAVTYIEDQRTMTLLDRNVLQLFHHHRMDPEIMDHLRPGGAVGLGGPQSQDQVFVDVRPGRANPLLAAIEHRLWRRQLDPLAAQIPLPQRGLEL